MTNLLYPPCAEAIDHPCARCGSLPGQDCGDTAARAAQEALRPLDGSQTPATPSEAPTGLTGGGNEALGLPWATEGGFVVLADPPPGTYGPVASYVDEGSAAFIVHAANHHAELVAALVDCLASLEIAEKVRRPQWDGSVTPTSVIGVTRALLARIREGGGV